jgi:Ca-activated chloride channel family protein
MKLTRSHLVAGALLIATAAAAAVARSSLQSMPPASNGGTFVATRGQPIKFSGTLDRKAVLLGGDGQARIELVMAADDVAGSDAIRQPTDLVIVLDRSGSMHGEKIHHARAAIHELLRQLSPDDRFALVTYADWASITIPLAPGEGSAAASWAAAIDGIQPNGSTNMSGGLDVAFELIGRSRTTGRVPHLILISDGLANAGDASRDGLMRRAQQAAQGEHMLSTIGVGADFNEYLMTALADAGTGNYYYVRNPHGLSDVFARELDAARTTVASGLTVRIEPAAGVRVVDAAGYPLATEGGATVFRPGSLFTGQERRVWVTLSVPSDRVGEHELGRFELSYTDAVDRRSTLRFENTPSIACVEDKEQFYSDVDVGAWSRSVVVDTYNKMKEEVAREVKAGRRDAALQKIDEFRNETSTLNDRLRSAPVARQLGATDELEADVRSAFEGEDQGHRQNELSKAASADAVGARRAGSTK